MADEKKPVLFEDGHLKCPHCGSPNIVYVQMIPAYYPVMVVPKGRPFTDVVQISSDYELGDGGDANWECGGCDRVLADPTVPVEWVDELDDEDNDGKEV